MTKRFVVNLFFALFVASSVADICSAIAPDDSLDRIGPLAQATPEINGGVSDATKTASTQFDEQPLLEFVEQHQPSLVKLLKYMKRKQPQQYEQALKELTRVKQRLNSLEKRDTESYAIELELWQVRSKLRMLVAEILASDKNSQDKLRTQLRALVEKEIDLDLARLQLEQKRVEQRLSSVQSPARRTNDRSRRPRFPKLSRLGENRAFKSSSRSKKQ